MAANNHKRLRTSDEEAPAEALKGGSIKLALGDLYQETVQLRSDVKELKDDVHNLLKNQSQLSKDLKSIAEILNKSKSKLDDKNEQPPVQDEVTSDTSEEKNIVNGIAVRNDTKSNEQLLDDDDSIDELDEIGRMLQEQGCQTEPVTILPEDITKSNAEMRYDIKSVLHNQTTLASNMKSIFDLIKKHTNPKPYPPKVEVQEPLLIQPISIEQTANNDDVEEITEVEPVTYEIQCIDGAGPSNAGEINLKTSPVPRSLSIPASGILRPVPKIIPGPYTGTFLVGGDSTLVRDIAEYESILMQIYTKKPHESDNEKARVLLRHLFRMVIPPEILATCNVTGKSRDAVTHRWIRVPKIDEALLLPIFNQTRFQFPEFTDWYTDDKSRTVQYLNNVCKTVRHSSQNPNNKSPTS